MGERRPAENKAAADEVTAAWVKAFDSGDAKVLATIYAEDARSTPPGTGTLSGRGIIENYRRDDIGSGGISTKLTPNHSLEHGDLLHVAGEYEVAPRDDVPLAKGQYHQLRRRADNQWVVQHEIWRPTQRCSATRARPARNQADGDDIHRRPARRGASEMRSTRHS